MLWGQLAGTVIPEYIPLEAIAASMLHCDMKLWEPETTLAASAQNAAACACVNVCASMRAGASATPTELLYMLALQVYGGSTNGVFSALQSAGATGTASLGLWGLLAAPFLALGAALMAAINYFLY